jgi:two-component system cell cycle sensor histidine kinase/response regulator CckA
VTQSGGHIEVRNRAGGGAVFVIRLPCVEPPPVAVAQPAPAPSRVSHDDTVLLVEDDAAVRHFCRAALVREGYDVIEAASGTEALQICRERSGPIHLLLTDIVMPGMNGVELAAAARRIRPDMKWLFMSGYADHVLVRNNAARAGSTLLNKPFNPGDLARRVREALDRPH